eukprot:scaffold738_cov340-Pavlova_lutheri.AAC.5
MPVDIRTGNPRRSLLRISTSDRSESGEASPRLEGPPRRTAAAAALSSVSGGKHPFYFVIFPHLSHRIPGVEFFPDGISDPLFLFFDRNGVGWVSRPVPSEGSFLSNSPGR